jgi:hypothetical protein
MEQWSYFAGWSDLILAGAGLLLGTLLLIWWRQQSDRWYTVFSVTLLSAALIDVATFSLFVIPPHFVGCPDGCAGQMGYPLPFATVGLDGNVSLYLLDFVLNLLLIWLLLFVLTVLARIFSEAVDLGVRSRRFKVGFFILFFALPLALLPRYFNPPEPPVYGDELRLSVNARRAAEMTYNVTGLWVQRLALEDIRYAPIQVPDVFGGIDRPQAQICLRGYVYFYIPWMRYRITLDRAGVTALNMTRRPLTGSCWGEAN